MISTNLTRSVSNNIITTYPVTKNLLDYTTKIINEKPRKNAAYLAEGVIKRVNLINTLDEYHKKNQNDLRPSGYAREWALDIEAINMEAKQVADKYLPQLEQSLNNFSEALEKNIKDNPEKNIELLSKCTFGNNSLLTSLILTACALPRDSEIFKIVEEILYTATPVKTKKMLKYSLYEAGEILNSIKDKKEKYENAVVLASALSNVAIVFFPPAGLGGKVATSVLTAIFAASKFLPDKLDDEIKNINFLKGI